MKLDENGISKQDEWLEIGVQLPLFDIPTIRKTTKNEPIWIHFGTGNIFRGFIAALQQKLLNNGFVDKGIIAVKSSGFQVIEKIFTPYDNLNLLVQMSHDGKMEKEIIASIAETIKADSTDQASWSLLKEIFKKPSLQLVSLTITEKGYVVQNNDGSFLESINTDIEQGPNHARYTMSILTSMLYERYKNGEHPIALVSMDNCSQNGRVLKNGITTIAKAWLEKGYIDQGFIAYLNDEDKVSFPWTVIDKITPNPSEEIRQILEDLGIEGMQIISSGSGSGIAPFVNAEITEYLIVEEKFPNSRPPLEKAGVIFTDKETVERVEKMKVGTCLNPLHTALAIFGCLLGYSSISNAMMDADLVELIRKIAFDEAMPVVVDPGIIKPDDFVKEVIEVRFPNPHIPDTPQRIATDTSQKIPVRFGGTLQAYLKEDHLDITKLTFIPMVFAAWLRYLMGVDDEGKAMKLSPDPMLDVLKQYVEGIEIGNKEFDKGKIVQLLKNEGIFGVDLQEQGLANKVIEIFQDMISQVGGVRTTLKKYLNQKERL